MTINRKIASIYYEDMAVYMIQTSSFREINIPIKMSQMTCLQNQPPVVTMKRPVVEYAMVWWHSQCDLRPF